MAFKYINPGLADLFDEVSPYRIQYENLNKDFSRTSGYGFTTGGALQALYLEKNKSYWVAMGIRFSRYSDYSMDICFIDAQSADYVKDFTNWLRIESSKFDDTRMIFKVRYKDTIIYESKQSININTMYHLEFCAKDDPVNGEVKLWVDGKLFIDYKGKTGEGNGFNRLEINSRRNFYSSSFNEVSVISDLIVQNIGRIGDMRVNVLPCQINNGLCEWDINYPVGYKMCTDDNIRTSRTYIFTNSMFDAAGKVESIRVSQCGSNPTIFKFCIFRKNPLTNKYNAIQTTKELRTFQEGVQELALETPLIIEQGDYLGFYSPGNFYCYRLDNVCSVFETNDKTNAQEIEMPTPTYNWAPCVHAIFIPDDKIVGYKKAVELQTKNKELVKYINFSTNTADKNLLYMLDVPNIKVGRIDSIAITSNAKYDGESQVKGLAAVIKDDTNNYESSTKATFTSYKHLSIATLDKNPLTSKEWSKNDLQNIKLGIKSKV